MLLLENFGITHERRRVELWRGFDVRWMCAVVWWQGMIVSVLFVACCNVNAIIVIVVVAVGGASIGR